MDQNSAWHLLGLGFLIVPAPARGKARWRCHPFLHKPLRKEWDGEQRSSCLCSAPRGAALPDHPEGRLWDGTGEGEIQTGVFGIIPWPAEPQPSFPGRCGASGAWQQLHDPAVIIAAGRAAPAEGSCLLCHSPRAIPGNYPYLWQENRLLMHQHSCFDTFDE